MKYKVIIAIFSLGLFGVFTSCFPGKYKYQCYPKGNLKEGVKFYLYDPDEKQKKGFTLYMVEIYEKVNDSISNRVWLVRPNKKLKKGFIEYGKLISSSEDSFNYHPPKLLKKNRTYFCNTHSSRVWESGSGYGGCVFRIDSTGTVVNVSAQYSKR